MDLSTFENSDAISLKDAMQAESTVDPNQNKEPPDVTCLFKNPTQIIAPSSVDSENGNNPEIIFTANSKCCKMASTTPQIKVTQKSLKGIF